MLKTRRVILRRLTQTDLTDFLYYRSKAAIARYQLWEPFTSEQTEQYIEQYMHSQPGMPGEWFQLGIIDRNTNRLIGGCSIKMDAFDPRIAEVGLNISRDFQKQGMAIETLSALFDYAFTELRVHRIFAITDCENIACVKLLERLKMRREGHYLENIWFKGGWGSEYCYAILENEWPVSRLV